MRVVKIVAFVFLLWLVGMPLWHGFWYIVSCLIKHVFCFIPTPLIAIVFENNKMIKELGPF